MPFRAAGLQQTVSCSSNCAWATRPCRPTNSIDPVTFLARAPGSGLSATFANNEAGGAPPITVCLGRYDIDPANLVFGHVLGPFLPYRQ